MILGTVKNKCCAKRAEEAFVFLHKKCPGQQFKPVLVERKQAETPEDALLRALAINEIDLAAIDLRILNKIFVSGWQFEHSQKKLTVCGMLPRGDARSVLVTARKSGKYMPNAVVEAVNLDGCRQLPDIYENISCLSGMGGIYAEIGRLAQGQCDGILLPADDVKRLRCHRKRGLRYQYLDTGRLVPAAGQAVTALVVRHDSALSASLWDISDIRTVKAAEIEREMLCRLPEAVLAKTGACVFAEIDRGQLSVCTYVCVSGAGLRFREQGNYEDRERLLTKLADKIQQLVEYS